MSVYLSILEALRRVGGKALEQNLLDEVRKRGLEISHEILTQTLLKLEIHGKVRVLSLDQQRRVVELVENT